MHATTPTRLALAALAASVALVPAAGAASGKVRAPRSGQYHGTPRGNPLSLYVSGKSLELVALSFKCGQTVGSTSLNDIDLKKTRKGYRFSIAAHGNISFADEQPDENGAVSISGRFARDGKTARGVFRVKSHRCHTGSIKWTARR
jgi:hypothetical protein